IAAFLYAQIENLDDIQNKRKHIRNTYYNFLKPLEETGKIKLPRIPDFATNNAHMFYVLCKNLEERSALIEHLKRKDINAVFHYLSLHKSPFYTSKHDGREMLVSDKLTDTLVRFPFYYELSDAYVTLVTDTIIEFYSK